MTKQNQLSDDSSEDDVIKIDDNKANTNPKTKKVFFNINKKMSSCKEFST